MTVAPFSIAPPSRVPTPYSTDQCKPLVLVLLAHEWIDEVHVLWVSGGECRWQKVEERSGQEKRSDWRQQSFFFY